MMPETQETTATASRDADAAPSNRILDLSPGELVRVRSASEIFSTLDGHGRLDNLPFMPEMLRYCGMELRVDKRAEKTCVPDHGLRRVPDTVFLTGARCDGTAHGGCKAACLLYWKEAWLKRVEPGPRGDSEPFGPAEEAFVVDTLMPATIEAGSTGGTSTGPAWECQATTMHVASTRLRGWDFDQYPRDARNWGWFTVIRTMLIEAFNRAQTVLSRRLPKRLLLFGGRTYPYIDGSLEKGETPTNKLNLQPGDRVRIRSKEEIVKTLDKTNHTRGLSFDVEMVKYCGRTATVRARVDRLIDEVTGEMIHIKSDCIILEDVVCTSDYHRLCARGIYPYWREAWLERVP
jgi:hypothetical protein